MPPEENTNKNTPASSTFKIGIDPVFKSNSDLQRPTNTNQNPVVTPSQPADMSSVFGALNNQKYSPDPALIIKPVEPIVQNNLTNPKSVIRTYKSDLEAAIQADHLSSINIAIAENEKMHNQIKMGQGNDSVTDNSDYSKSKIMIFISLILVVIGVVGIGYIFLAKGQNPTVLTQAQEFPSLITTEIKDELNTNLIIKDKFVKTLSEKLNDSQIPANNFYNLYLTVNANSTKKLINSAEFISLLGLKIPDIVGRTLLPNFMVGVYSFGKNLPFIILKTSSFENTYAGMLAWEKDLEKDFQLLFRLPGYENYGNIVVALTPTETKKFEDGVIVNKDVRLLRNDAGQIMFLYGIIDKETIVITMNDLAFKEIINRLNKEKTLKR